MTVQPHGRQHSGLGELRTLVRIIVRMNAEGIAGIAGIIAGNGSQPQYRHAVLLADQLDRLQQPDNIRRTVVRDDPSGAVTQEILTILEAYA